MHIYRTILELGGLEPELNHRATLAEAHETAKLYPLHRRADVYVELIDVPTDKDGILALMQGAIRQDDHEPLRTWKLTPRGGLKEVPAEE